MTGKFLAGFVFSSVWVSATLSGPLPKEQIPASAQWVVHLDVERLAASQTCALLTADPNGGGALQKFLRQCRELLGVDLLKDLKQVTLYGDRVSGSRGVALCNGRLNRRSIIARLSTHPDYHTETAGKLVVHKWRDKTGGTEMQACFLSPQILLVASDQAMLLGAVAALNGKASSLATAKTALPLPAGADDTFFIAAQKGYNDAPPESVRASLLRNTKAATVEIGETKGIVNGRLVLTAATPEATAQIREILNGLIVAASLSSEPSGLARLAEKGRITSDSRSVSLTLTSPARDVAQAIESALTAPDKAANGRTRRGGEEQETRSPAAAGRAGATGE